MANDDCVSSKKAQKHELNKLYSRMENASDGCVKMPDDGANLAKSSSKDFKLKPMRSYVDKPIFKRKLIEKYSTARYNINTKRTIRKKSAASQPPCIDKVPKISVINASSSRVENDKKSNSTASLPDLSNDVLPAMPRICLVRDESLSKMCESNVNCENAETRETPNHDKKTVDSEKSSSSSVVSNKEPDPRLVNKIKPGSRPSSSSRPKTMWKIAPRSVYNQLWDLYQNTVEIKPENVEPEPKKETKKRNKCQWTKKRSRRKGISVLKKMPNKTYFDPYVECAKEAETQSQNSSASQSGDKLGFVMYLGVNRPVFPLVYRNLRVLNDYEDTAITDFWSEFALSTLVCKNQDKKCKPILVPVKDPELFTLVSECVQEITPASVLNVPSDKLASEDDVTVKNEVDESMKNEVDESMKHEDVAPVDVKQEENNVPEKKSKRVKRRKSIVSENGSKRVKRDKNIVPEKKFIRKRKLPSVSKTYGLRAKSRRKFAKMEPQKCDESKPIPPLTPIRMTPVRDRTPSPDLLPPVLSPNPKCISARTPTPAPPFIKSSSPPPLLYFKSIPQPISSIKTPPKTATPSSIKTPPKTATPSPIKTPTKTATPSPIKTPTKTATPSPIKTPTKTATPSPVKTPTKTATPSAVRTPRKTATPSPIKTPTKTVTTSPIKTPAKTRTPSPTCIRIASPSPTRIRIASPSPDRIRIPSPSPDRIRIPSPTPAPAPAPAPTRSPRSKPKNRRIRSKPRSRARPLDEKAILKKYGYKECQVAIPKLSDTLIKYLSAGNYSNESAQLSDPTERELIEETDDFGLIQCTRTDGILIDYLKRNRSLVYFYKLKKMLDFQKTNNKYFVCCNYMLIDRSNTTDEDVDIVSMENDGDDSDDDEETGLRHSRNPNDLFKSSKISEFKNKSYTISWVKNHDLRAVSNVKWLLISLDKHIACLSHANTLVFRYKLLFEIIYRAELSKKVICCEISKAPASNSDTEADSGTVGDKLAFGVYAFPGLCDKVLAGPYLYHEEHQFAGNIRTGNRSSEPVRIRTLEEKENFPQIDDTTPVKHINAKWWSGQMTSGDWIEQYLNFFFNPTVAKYVPPADKFCMSKVIDDHPCQSYHSYEITGRESNMVLFHDRTNAIQKTIVEPSTEPAAAVKTETTAEPAVKVASPTVPPQQSRNLRIKPRRDYSQLVTDDMVIPARTKNLEFHIVNVKSLRKSSVRAEQQAKSKRSRYLESPHVHIANERLRRKEFRERKNNLASVLESRSSGSNNTQSLASILVQSKEIINYLEVDNSKLDDEGKRLRIEQSVMMRKFLALLRGLDINSTAYKKGMAFVAAWKHIKSEHRNKLIDILGRNFDKQKVTKATEASKNSHTSAKDSTTAQRLSARPPIQRPVLIVRKPSFESENATNSPYSFVQYKNDVKKLDSEQSTAEDVMQRLKSRKILRQNMREDFRKRNQVEQFAMESVGCDISEEVVCEDGKLSNPFSSNHILDRLGEVPILIPKVPSNVDPYAVDPLADNDDGDDDGSADPWSFLGKYEVTKRKEPSHPLYLEHSYCSTEDEPPDNSSNMFNKHIPQIKSIYSKKPGPASMTMGSRYRPVRPITNSYRPQMTIPSLPNGYRPIRPIYNNSTPSLHQQRNAIRTRAPNASVSSSAFQIRVNKSADENLGIDILDNGRMFARLNIAKVSNGNDTNGAASSSGGGAAGASTSNKIMSIIQRFLMQMEKVPLPVVANDDERSKQARRKHVVNSLKSFISKFESRRRTTEDAGYSSSRTSNSENTSPPNVTDNIELESGYSSRSEESCDPDYNSNNTKQPIAPNCLIDDPAIENIVLDTDDDDDDNEDNNNSNNVDHDNDQGEDDEDELVESNEQEVEEEHVLRADEFIEEEEEEIIGEEELIEEEEEEEIVGDTLEEMNDVDAAMRGDDDDRFADSEDSAENYKSEKDDFTNVELVQDSEIEQPNGEQETFTSLKPTPKVLYTTNQFTIIRSKDKFIPNIMKTPTKTVIAKTLASDHLSRIQVKPSTGSVKMSTTAVLRPATIGPRPYSLSDGNNDSIIKRLWYSPVTWQEEAALKVLRLNSPLNEPANVDSAQSEKSVDEDKSQSNNEEAPNSDKDNTGANRILIKSFADYDKFKEAFLSNIDKLLNPES